jgi:hypothetical protein
MAEYKFDPDGKLEKALDETFKKTKDLTLPYTLMTREWFKANRTIFDLGRKSRGKYAELSPKYKKTKERYLGSAYPILSGFFKEKGRPARRSHKLAKSMTDPRNPDSVAKIINKAILILGTKVKSKKNHLYPASLHYGTKKMPARPVVLSGAEQVAPDRVLKRNKLWIKMLKKYIFQISKYAEKK